MFTYCLHASTAGTLCSNPVVVRLGGNGCPRYPFCTLCRRAQVLTLNYYRISFHVMNANSGEYALCLVVYWSECECLRERNVREMGYQVAVHCKRGMFMCRKLSRNGKAYPKVMKGNIEFVCQIILHRHDICCYI